MENKNFKYAGFWLRAIAQLIDTTLLMAILFGLVFVVYGGDLDAPASSIGGLFFVFIYLLPVVMTIGMWVKYQATPGKMIIGLKIVDVETGAAIGLGKSILRYICYFVSYIPLGLGYFWVGWDKKKQGFHDKLANTAVVHAK